MGFPPQLQHLMGARGQPGLGHTFTRFWRNALGRPTVLEHTLACSPITKIEAPPYMIESGTQTEPSAPEPSASQDQDDDVSNHSSKRSSNASSTASVHYRQDEEAIKAIDDDLFIKLLLQHLDLESALDPSDCVVEKRASGSFNHVVVLSVANLGQFAIKVPFHGTPELWQPSDAYHLRNEANTMNYLRKHTPIPIPEVLGFDDSFVNVLSAPYILMRGVEGKPAGRIWIPTNRDGTLDFANMDSPDRVTYNRRLNFLKSLANTMAELQKLEFAKIGMLNFDDDADSPTVSHYFRDDSNLTPKRIDAFTSSKSFYQAKLDKFVEHMGDAMEESLYGVKHLLWNIYRLAPFNLSQKEGDPDETFVLAHPDLDFQNIFVDDEGNITGIIDWDGALTVPRCIGYASVPVFLREDWDPDYDQDAKDAQMPWVLERYRRIYSEFMLEATSGGDGKYTLNSPLYHLATISLEQSSATPAFLEYVHMAIPSLRFMDKEKFMARLGSDIGFGSAEQMLAKELVQLFALKP
jgi:hypothetical protein